MRWIHLLVVVLFAAAVVVFVVQNLEMVTMSFLGFSARVPLALLAGIVYVVGMVTGGSLWLLLRRSLHGSQIAGMRADR
jgi:putative membrane protein